MKNQKKIETYHVTQGTLQIKGDVVALFPTDGMGAIIGGVNENGVVNYPTPVGRRKLALALAEADLQKGGDNE